MQSWAERGFSRAIAKLQPYFRGLEVAKAELAVKHWMWKQKGQTSPRIQPCEAAQSLNEWMHSYTMHPKASIRQVQLHGEQGHEPCSPFSHGKAGPEPHNPLDWPERGLTALSQRWPLPLPPWRPGAAPLESPPKWTSGTLEQKQDPNELQSTIVRFLLWDFKSDLNLQSRTFILHVSHMVSFVFLSNYIVKHRETYPELQKTEQWNCAPVNHQPLAFSKLHSVFQQHSLHT